MAPHNMPAPSLQDANGTVEGIESSHKSLLGLPPELRVLIYEHIFAADVTNGLPSLMRTSAFIRKEATPQYRQHLQCSQSRLAEEIERLEHSRNDAAGCVKRRQRYASGYRSTKHAHWLGVLMFVTRELETTRAAGWRIKEALSVL